MKMAMLPFLLCAVMLLSISEGTRWKWICPQNWALIAGRCFKYVPFSLTWAQAERTCHFKGGNLASVRNFAEHQGIQRYILAVTHRSGRTWIGGSDSAENHVWLWSDGKPMKYTNWCPLEPNNYGGNEHCVGINHEGKNCWNDQDCSIRLPSVCVKNRHRVRVRNGKTKLEK